MKVKEKNNEENELKSEEQSTLQNTEDVENTITEENKIPTITNETDNNPDKKSNIFIIIGIALFITILIILIGYCTFTLINSRNKNIINGVYIKDLNLSGLSKDEAKQKITEYVDSSIPDEIVLAHNAFATTISKDQLSINVNIDETVDRAYDIGRTGNTFQNNLTVLKSLLYNININPTITIDEDQLRTSLNDISNKLPDKLIQASCYIEDTNLIITKGTSGSVILIDESMETIINNINALNINNDNPIELITEVQSPIEINLDYIYSKVHKEATDAYYTQDPYMVMPSENGIDFAISMDEAKNILLPEQDEYVIPLKVLYPNVTTNMIGIEAFPDLLSEFSTNYAASNRNRTTNLILAANKIDGTVLMPDEVFSYNQVVGERTIQAGYKEAPIYVQGRVEDGLGGGICQITSTLYNAVLYANLEVVERSNHQFVPSYASASRDATVVYGSLDFKFKNNRDYPIKITCSVANGIANFKIWGLKRENDYQVEITSRITGSSANAIYSEAYKTLTQNGNYISTETISRDTYKRH